MATTTLGALDRGRAAVRAQAWATAADALVEAAATSPLDPADLELLATAAYLAGRDDLSTAAWEDAHREHLRRGDPARAARCGFWLSMALLLRGEYARGGGWVARAKRLVAESAGDCPERGFLMLPTALATMFDGGAAAAYAIFEQAAEIGERFAEPDLVALARHGQGQALVRGGDRAGGLALLDEVLASVSAGEVGPIAGGIIYCAVIETCHEAFDLRRVREWTAALSRWCEAQPELVPYRGQCLVHRSEVLQLSGEWPEAVREAQLACERLSTPAHPALGMAMYQLGELHRLCGRADEAEAAYAGASACGHYPQPGLALLRLGQGRVDAAVTAVRSAAAETTEPLARARILRAYVEIVLAAGDVADAHRAAEELAATAGELGSPTLRAVAAHAPGAVRLAEGDPAGALEALHTPRRSGGRCRRATTAHAPRSWSGWPAGSSATRTPPGSTWPAPAPAWSGSGRCRRVGRAGPGRRHCRTGRRGAEPARAAGAAAGGDRADQRGDRRRPRAQRAHRGPPRQQHPGQARAAVAVGGHRLGLRAPPGLSPPCARDHPWPPRRVGCFHRSRGRSPPA